MGNTKREPKYKVGDKVKFKFDGGIWVGTITDMFEYPACWDYEIYKLWHSEWDIIEKVE